MAPRRNRDHRRDSALTAFPAHRHQIGRDPQPNTTTCG
jgi:hypothetical protein